MKPLPLTCLSVRHPWAWLLFHGKLIENRDWMTSYRGRLGIHSSARMTKNEYEDAVSFVASFDRDLAGRIPPMNRLPMGAILGTVTLLGCVKNHTSPWFQGPIGWVLAHPELFPEPIPAKGQLGLWEWRG